MRASSMFVRLLLGASCLTPVLLASTPAGAQTITGPADAARVQERLNQPIIRQPGDELVQVEGPSIATAPTGSDKIFLTLQGVTLDGATVYSQDELAALYTPSLGQKISVAQVYQLAADITRKYRNDGYILTQVVVPPQTIGGGQVRLQVVEGVISSITVDGAANEHERKLVEAYAGQVQGEPLNTRKLEQAVLLVNDLPGISARSVISPDPHQPGGATLRVILEHKRYDAQISLDNFGSRFLGPLQAQAGLAVNSLLGLNERISTDLIYAPNEEFGAELAYGDLIYNQPVGPYGTRVEVTGALAASDPGYTLEQFNVNGRSVSYSVKVDQPVIRTRATNWNVYGLFDGRDNFTQSNIDDTRKDHIRALRVGTTFSHLDRLLGGGFNSLSVELGKGLGILGASDEGDANLSRAEGDPQFTKVEAEAQRLQRLTGNLNLLMAVRGQFANDALLSSEEFGVGGPRFGRGYDPSEIVGDDGIAGKLELQLNDPLAVTWLRTWQLYSFLDAGRVWNDDATTASDRVMSVVSVGAGARATLRSDTEANLYVALPINRDVQTLGDDDPRVFFSLGQKF